MVGSALLNCGPYTSIPWWYASGYNHKSCICLSVMQLFMICGCLIHMIYGWC
jgi:hypothetical protein